MNSVTVYGVVVLVFMMGMYAMEGRHRRYIAAFAAGCALSSSYGFMSGAWPFGAVEAVWCLVALRRYINTRPAPAPTGAGASLDRQPDGVAGQHREHHRGDPIGPAGVDEL